MASGTPVGWGDRVLGSLERVAEGVRLVAVVVLGVCCTRSWCY